MSEIQRSVDLLVNTLKGKGEDYRGSRGEFFNFEVAANFVKIPTYKAILIELAKKMTRLQTAIDKIDAGVDMNYESYIDTLLDIAGYAIIAHAHESKDR